MNVNAQNDLWTDWLKKAQDGDKDAYRALLEAVYEKGRSFLVRRLSDPQVAAELLQEAMVALHRGLGSFDRNHTGHAWVYSILRNKLFDHFRKHGREEIAAIEVELIASLTTAESDDQSRLDSSQWLNANLQSLSEVHRNVFFLAQIEGHSLEVVATKLKLSLANVKVSLHRARLALKEKYLREGSNP